MYPQKSNRSQKIITTAAIFVALTLIVFGVKAFSDEEKTESAVATTSQTVSGLQASDQTETTTQSDAATASVAAETQPSSTASTAAAEDTSSTYSDGTYTAVGSYKVEGKTEKISITLSVKADVVTDTSATNMASDRESKEYQSDFISVYKSQVVGKALSSLKLGVVSGASLTPIGFNNAVATIRSQAQS